MESGALSHKEIPMHATTSPVDAIVLLPLAARAALTDRGAQVLEMIRAQSALPASDTEGYADLDRRITHLLND